LLIEKLKSSLPREVRRDGGEYWRRGAVEVVALDTDRIEAIVESGTDYEVGLFWNGETGVVDGVCTCPNFIDGSLVCEHIWALVIAADTGGGLSGVSSLDGVRLEPAPDRFDELFLIEELAIDPRQQTENAPEKEAPSEPEQERPREPKPSTWRETLGAVKRPEKAVDPGQLAWIDAGRRIIYRIDVQASKEKGNVVVDLLTNDRNGEGSWGMLKASPLKRHTIAHLPDVDDRELLAMIIGGRAEPGANDWQASSSFGASDHLPNRFTLPRVALSAWVQRAATTGRLAIKPESDLPLYRRPGPSATLSLEWDDGPPWQLQLTIEESDDVEAGDSDSPTDATAAHGLRLTGALVRPAAIDRSADASGDRRVELSEPALFSAAGLVFFHDRVARFEDGGAFSWIPALRQEPEIRVPAEQREEFIDTFLNLPRPPLWRLPESLQFEEVMAEPRPQVALKIPGDGRLEDRRLLATELSFDYEGHDVRWRNKRAGIYQPAARRFIRRDRVFERRAFDRLVDLGARDDAVADDDLHTDLLVPERQLTRVVHTLVSEGWRVDVEGQRYRSAESLDLALSGEIDWFDLRGKALFDEASVGLPRLLEALRRGKKTVALDDGSIGFLPEAWRDRLGSLSRMADATGDGLRFGRHQIGLIDALLIARPEIGFDPAVAHARQQLDGFSGVKARPAPSGFRGELRDYQEEGLGWLFFLREFRFGGCLADDMGLGKTMQVLALLEARREERTLRLASDRENPRPSLVVMPKSIIFNWQREAERFAPQLSLLDYTGPGRTAMREQIADVDLVLTTYGTMRRDIEYLKDVPFDYAILDEAQAIKNPKSATAKASRLLTARHRLALTGTPVENHVGELMSVLDFLNPGLFGPDRRLKVPKSVREVNLNSADPDRDPQATPSRFEEKSTHANPRQDSDLALIAGAVRPFILRRTKGQVAKDLPEKVEQTLYCELPDKQREDYDLLATHYRNTLLGRVDSQGLGSSKIHVLEALLRLRQAACHPGLIEPERRRESSGKLDVFLPQLEEVIEEGHKALVFSQFTSMLSIVRTHLDDRGITYEYLDGKTRQRESRIERFQEDPSCPVFLISLKAGGVGLNLTAAEYVFLLDPWWNPAVEAQAIDRTHRIGQTRPVFAYSLIARNTIEEKILTLQKKKRELAEAVIRADTSLIRNLTREELAELLA